MVHRIRKTIGKLALAAATRTEAGRIRHRIPTAPGGRLHPTPQFLLTRRDMTWYSEGLMLDYWRRDAHR